MKNLSWRPIIVVAVIVIAVIYVLPTINPTLWPHKKINLGLDLQGGMHLALEVESHKAVESTVERLRLEMRTLMKKERIRHRGIERVEGNKILVNLRDQENLEKFEKLLADQFPGIRIASRSDSGEAPTITLELPDREVDTIKKLAVDCIAL